MKINLLPQEEEKDSGNKSFYKDIINIGLVTFLGVFFIFGIKFGINYYLIQNLNKDLAAVKRLEEPLAEYAEAYEKFTGHEARSVLSNQQYFSKLTDFFENTITTDIKITGVSFEGNNNASVQGYSTNGIKSFSIFENAINKAGFTNLTVSSLAVNKDSNRVDFSVSFNYDPALVKR